MLWQTDIRVGGKAVGWMDQSGDPSAKRGIFGVRQSGGTNSPVTGQTHGAPSSRPREGVRA